MYNPILSNGAHAVRENRGNGQLEQQTTKMTRRTSTSFLNLLTNEAVLVGELWANSNPSSWWQIFVVSIKVTPGKRYCFSAFVDAWMCAGELIAQELTVNGSWVRNMTSSPMFGRAISGYTQNGAIEENYGFIDPNTRQHVFFTAPPSGQVSLVVQANDLRTTSTLKVARPMLEECTEYTQEPSHWQNSGVTAIHGGRIVTNTITAQQMAANTITANEIASGAIATRHLSANSVNAGHVVSKSLTADKLNINSLSAISANLGAVTAGSININNRFKVNTNGQVEMRSATANVGMVINNDQILVYDEQGRIRVKIGRL